MSIASDHLLLFTRYPEPGQAKTRLIPALGSQGAADLHRALTEHTLQQVQALGQIMPVTVNIYFDGSSVEAMQAWLGPHLTYHAQICGDLGERMSQAFQAAFQAGARQVVIIGSDCPGLTAALLHQTFQHLSGCDVVLGPAKDGGYYLLGLGQFIPDLFCGIAWGSPQVYDQTRQKINHGCWSYRSLPRLGDIDRPEDLLCLPAEVWRPGPGIKGGP